MSILKKLRDFAKKQNETLEIETIDVHLPSLPPELDGYRIAVVADLHIRTLGPYHAYVLDAVRAIRPECILIAGDSVDAKTESIEALSPFFGTLTSLAPTIAILGNNDCQRGRIHTLRDMYRDTGVILLENETRLLSARGFPLRITGMLDPHAKKVGIEPEHVKQREDYVPLSETLPPQEEEMDRYPSLLMVHQPNLAPVYAAMEPSLIIAGHAHGGQFRLPRVGGLYAPDQGFLPRLTSGLYSLGSSQLIVSRGIGNHVIYQRINNHPHIPVAVLRV